MSISIFLPLVLKKGKCPKVLDLKSRECYFVSFRNSIITKRFLGQRVCVAGDIRQNSILIRSEMLGRKFGEFSFTKKTGRKIHPDKDKIRGKKSIATRKKKVIAPKLVREAKKSGKMKVF